MKKIESEFVTYPLSLRMKVLGYDEPCLGSYYNDSEENLKEGAFDYRRQLNIEYSIYIENTYYILSPTFQSAFSWLIPQIDGEFKVCLDEEGWYIYNLKNEIFRGDEAVDKLITIVENSRK